MRIPILKLSGFLALAGILNSSTATTRANDIEPGKEFYTATIAGNPIVVDGDLSEWVGVPVLADPKFSIPKGSGAAGKLVLFEEYNGGTWTGPDDQTSAVQIVYDVNNVYFGFVVTDDYHENAANSAWNGDSVQLMIANADRNQQIALYNYALGGVEGALGDVIVNHEAGPAADDNCACATEAVVKRDEAKKKTYYEIKLPAASLGLTALTPGTKFGLGMAINDGDGGPGQEGQKGWGGLGAHSIVFGKTPSETALITLGTEKPGASDRLFFSAINPTIDSFSFRASDKGASIVDAASATLTIDGEVVTLTSKKSGDATDFSYKRTSAYPSASDHTYKIEVKDTQGNTVTSEGTFKTQTYTTLPATWAVTADTAKKGFLVRTWQSPGEPNNIAWAEEQLNGLHGDNAVANPSVFNQNAYGSSYFNEPGTINYWNSGGEGNFPNDATQNTPGLANDGTNDDSYSLEVISFLDLPAGISTMGVNSDDGFRVYAGANPLDRFAPNLGEFNAGRGVADTTFLFYAEKAGVYPFRLVYEEGGGDAAVEWFTVAADGTKHLINDASDSAAIKAYAGTTTPLAPFIKSLLPSAGTAAASVNGPLGAVLVDGQTKIDSASVALTLNGQAITPTVTQNAGTTTINYTPTPALTPGKSYKLELTFKDSAGASRTVNWSFQTEITTAVFTAGTLFVEAEDADFGHGQYVKDQKIGMDGPYPGGSYAGLGTADDLGFDWNADSNNGQTYRPDTSIAAGKENGSAGDDRGSFQVTSWWTLGWNDPGEWYNYTRDFPTPAKDYTVYGHLASGGAAINIQLDQITAGQGQDDSKQVKKLLGYFRPGRATAGWDNLELFQLTDDSGNPVSVNLGGNVTLRTTLLPGSASDQDYFAFVPGAAIPTSSKFTSFKLTGGKFVIEWSGNAKLQKADAITGPWTDVAGATSPNTIDPTQAAAFYRLSSQ